MPKKQKKLNIFEESGGQRQMTIISNRMYTIDKSDLTELTEEKPPAAVDCDPGILECVDSSIEQWN